MRAPDGRDYWVRGMYREVTAPERLRITCTAEDDQGVARLEETIDVSFEEQGGRTLLRLNATAGGAGPEAEAMLAGMPKGWAQTVDRLDTHVSTRSEKET